MNKYQKYKGIQFCLIDRKSYKRQKAKRFLIIPTETKFATNQNVWIPNKHLDQNGSVEAGENIDYVFRFAGRQAA